MGVWQRSPFGRFSDVMVETATGHRVLLAPSAEIANYVASTYSFDEVRVTPVRAALVGDRLEVSAPELRLHADLGGTTALGRLLRLVPAPLARSTTWLRAIDPIARVLVPGVRTAGSAGNGRTEFYGVGSARAIDRIQGEFEGADLGSLDRLDPPVRFGFGSAPARPQIVRVTTTIAV